jgi:glycosyltransferase involved in cell wall biosynthesis
MKISVCVLAYNDAERITDFINSLKGIDDIVVSVDEFTTDKTAEIATKLGARVVKRSDFWCTPTEKDIKRFEERFGYKPHFTTENKFCHSGKVRNEAMSYCKNDWVFFPDSDEIVTWDLKVVNKLLPLYDQIGCNYFSSWDENGKPVFGFITHKLFKKSMHTWVGRVHETPAPIAKVRSGFCTEMKMDHHHIHRIVPPDKASRNLQAMEYAVVSDYDDRTMIYLARELLYTHEYQNAIHMYNEYLKLAFWEPEIVEAHLKLAMCYWQIGEGSKSREHCLEALRNNPQNTEALYMMGVYYNEPWSHKWKELAKSASNEDALFKSEYKLLNQLYG